MVKITAVLLVTVVCILDFGTCLFYTDSKENDYPRIGKRKRYNDYVDETDFYGRKFRDSIKSMHSLTMNEAVIPSVLLFQFFDIDNDGFISTEEFSRRMSKGLNYLMERKSRW